MSDDLKSCPFCGSDDLGSGGDDKVVGYWCNSCEATGPNHYGRYEWNSRTDRIEELEAKLAKAVEALRWQADIINDSLTGNEVGKHRILLDGEYHEGPVVNWVHKILTGFEHINRATIAKLTGGKDE